MKCNKTVSGQPQGNVYTMSSTRWFNRIILSYSWERVCECLYTSDRASTVYRNVEQCTLYTEPQIFFFFGLRALHAHSFFIAHTIAVVVVDFVVVAAMSADHEKWIKKRFIICKKFKYIRRYTASQAKQKEVIRESRPRGESEMRRGPQSARS